MKHRSDTALILAGLSLCLMLGGCQAKEAAHTASSPSAEAQASAQEDAAWLDQALDPFLNDGSTLPSQTGSGKAVAWSVKSGHAQITDNVIHKTAEAAEYEPVELHAVIGSGTDAQEADYGNLLLLDPYEAYLMTCFSEKGDGKETLLLAYSYNEMSWFRLNDGQPVVRASTGTGRLRDPALVRKADGSFELLATEGYDNPDIYVYDSPDAVHYANERLATVNYSSADLSMSGKQAWAPEALYDRRSGEYVVYWSSPEDGGMYYNTTTDFVTFSAPKKLLDCGFPVIDGTIFKQGHDYAIILKDEREPLKDHAQLFVGFSDTDYLGFSRFSDPITDGKLQYEGPFVVKRYEENNYLIYYDNYTQFQFKAIATDDVFQMNYAEEDQSRLSMPYETCAHANAIPVTKKEMVRLMDAFGTGE